MKTQFSDRLQFAFNRENARRRDAGLPALRKKDIWEPIGATSAAATHWFSGANAMTLETCFKVAPILRVNAWWLYDESKGVDDPGERDPHHAQQPTAGDLPPSSNGQQSKRAAESPVNDKGEPMQTAQILTIAASNTRDTITIPQYDAGGAMGHGLVLPEQPGVIERWTVSREWLEKNARGFTSAGNLCIVTGFGPSMRPMFNPGDPLLVDTGVKSVIADGIYFFRIDDKGYIKQLQQIPKSGGGIVYRAKSANPAYDSFEIDEGHDFEILGRVIRVWCGTDF